jgi:hypothetical protein
MSLSTLPSRKSLPARPLKHVVAGGAPKHVVAFDSCNGWRVEYRVVAHIQVWMQAPKVAGVSAWS